LIIGVKILKEKIVKISNLTKVFDKNKKPALDCINAEISQGILTGLIGPDAAGKTTLIRIMAGLLKPTSGNVKILENDTILNAEKIYDIISYMPQKFGLYEDLSVIQNLNLYADLFSLKDEEKKEKFEHLLKFTNLKAFTNRLARNLSGGMKQKLGLACTLLRKPKILLLDEPSVGVDPISRRELWSMVSELTKENISILWSTSYLDEAEKCQEVLVLNEGKMLYFGEPKKLTEKLNKRTFQITNISQDRRVVSQNILKKKEIIDSVIQGAAVRIILQPDVKIFDIKDLDAGPQAKLKEVSPRFEDAFMDLLKDKINKETSPLVKLFPELKKKDKAPVEVKNLVKKFGDFIAVNDINFSVNSGEIFGLLGPNGAGKSTTFKMLCGLLKPTQGEAFISGLSLNKVKSQARAKLGYMAQKFSLYENLTVKQNLNFFSGIYPIEKKHQSDVVKNMMDIFNLSSYTNAKTSQLPLGYKQRLSLSCAIMHNPEILFLDEPTSGVDPITRREFWNHINTMVKKGVSIIITTHFMDEAEYCDRIALINQGRIIKIGSPDDLKNSVATKENPFPTLEDAFVVLSSKTMESNNAK
jgi:ABC-2 type transport system ATP-binding protein